MDLNFRHSAVVVAVAASAFFGGCATDRNWAEVPMPTNFKTEGMLKLQSASHWNNVAVDMAAGVSKKYSSGGGCIPGFGCQVPLYVKPAQSETRFTKAFQTQLVSALVNLGLPVYSQPKDGGTTVEIDVQVVNAQSSKNTLYYDWKPSELVEGVWVIRDVSDTAIRKFSDSKIDQWKRGETNNNSWFRSPADVPKAEMLVTVSFVNSNQYIARTTNIYYLNNVDGYVPVAASITKPEKKDAWEVKVVGDCTPERCFKN